jgi:hypothetical protein
MPQDLSSRVEAIREAVQQRHEADKLRIRADRYRGLEQALGVLLTRIRDLRSRSRLLEEAGCPVERESLGHLAEQLKRERARGDILEFDTTGIDQESKARLDLWGSRLSHALQKAEDSYPGVGLAPEVLATLERHFPEEIAEIKEAARQRSHAKGQREKAPGYLAHLKALHEQDLACLGRISGGEDDGSWREAMTALVSREGITWLELEQSPLLEWLKKHDLLQHSKVRLR